MVKRLQPSYAARSMRNPNVAVLLLRVRQLHRLTIAQVAELAGISVGMLSMLEHGKRRPSVVVAEHLADAYKLPPYAREMLLAEAIEGVGKDWRNRPTRDGRGFPGLPW